MRVTPQYSWAHSPPIHVVKVPDKISGCGARSAVCLFCAGCLIAAIRRDGSLSGCSCRPLGTAAPESSRIVGRKNSRRALAATRWLNPGFLLRRIPAPLVPPHYSTGGWTPPSAWDLD